jgi:hypothetical protein
VGAPSLTFSDAIDVLATDPSFSVAGTFVPTVLPARTLPTGVPVPCRVIINRSDVEVGIGGRTRARNPGWLVLLRQSDIPDAPRDGDQLVVSEGPWLGTYKVHAIRETHFGPTWTVEVGVLEP